MDEGIVSGFKSSGAESFTANLFRGHSIGSLKVLAGGQIHLGGTLHVSGELFVQGYADHLGSTTKAKMGSIGGTNLLTLQGSTYVAPYVSLACPVENLGETVVEHLGEFRHSTNRWWNRLGSRLVLNYPRAADLSQGTPGGIGSSSVWGGFNRIENDAGASVEITMETNYLRSFGLPIELAKNEGVVDVYSGNIAFACGPELSGTLRLGAEANVRLGTIDDAAGLNRVAFKGAHISGDGILGTGNNAKVWHFDNPMTFDVALSNRQSSVPKTFSGAAFTTPKGAIFMHQITLDTQMGEGLTAFFGRTHFDSTVTLRRSIDNFGTMTFTTIGDLKAEVQPIVSLRNHPGSLLIFDKTFEGALSSRDVIEAAGVKGVLFNLLGAKTWFPVAVDTESLRVFAWDFINDGSLRVDGGFLRFIDGFQQGIAGLLQVDTGAGIYLSAKATNLLGRVMGNGTVFATNIVLNTELSPHSNLDAAISAGQLRLSGVFQLGSLARTMIDISGRPSSPELFDRLVVTGRVTLGGRLNIFCTNGLAPLSGDRWRVVNVAGQMSNAFETVSFINLPAGFFGSVITDTNGIEVQLNRVGDPVNYSNWNSGQSFPNPDAGFPGADPDSDGYANAIEYAFGSNPLSPTLGLIQATHETIEGVPHVVLRFRRPAGPAKPIDLVFRYERARTVGAWETFSPYEEIGPIQADNSESVEVRIPVNESQSFFKIGVEI